MNEFEESDYASARSYADTIKGIADNIQGVFDGIDTTMNNLYGEGWRSSGAEEANARYQELRRNYEVFYNNVVTMRNHIYTVTNRNEEADIKVGTQITDAMGNK